MIKKSLLIDLYFKKGKSAFEISQKIKCSIGQVNYWLSKYRIKKRSISDAIYLMNNPKGDPFYFRKPKDISSAILFGLGMGLYWGEGTKADKSSVRLGNTDPDLVLYFIKFLEQVFSVNKKDLRFSLQIFSDMTMLKAESFWTRLLNVSKKQFYKTTVTPYRSIGNYRHKTKNGVIIVYYHNKRLRDSLVKLLEERSFLSL